MTTIELTYIELLQLIGIVTLFYVLCWMSYIALREAKKNKKK
jgi:hypothetical protein